MVGDRTFTVIWLLWAVLWFGLFLLLARHKDHLTGAVGVLALGEGLLTAAVRGDDEVGRRDHLEPADEEVQRRGAGRAHVPQQHDAVDHQHGTDVEQADGAHGSPARQ